MKLLFFRPSGANFLPSQSFSYQSGVPLSLGTSIRDHLEAFKLVGNSGNMIHRMAMVQMLDFDRRNSSQINLFKLIRKYGDVKQVADLINEHFDGLVITMSNVVRRDAKEPQMAELMALLRCKIYCVGIGLQDELPKGDATVLAPDVLRYLQVLNEKASLFGVRGPKTESWLHSIGISNAKAIGCPSIFAYPASIMKIEAPPRVEKVMTAGHISFSRKAGSRRKSLIWSLFSRKAGSRSQLLIRSFDDVDASYVFQGEHKNFTEILDVLNVYNEATQTLDVKIISDYLENKTGFRPTFSKYYSFNEVAAWRQACLRYDAYAGDRIHGGVAAMQVGIPSLILFADARVKELTEYHFLPSCSVDEFSQLGCRKSIELHLNNETVNALKSNYPKLLRRFIDAVEGSGLKVQSHIRAAADSEMPIQF